MEIPSRVGKYRVIKKLGQGASGCVLKVQQDVVGRIVALKILFSNLIQSRPNVIKRFEREARLASSLVHPNIVLIYDIDESNGVHYYTMQYIEGVPMVQEIGNTNISFQQRLNIMTQFCDALSLAHKKGIIHRDLKPHNVIITPDYTPVILDFGIAKSLLEDEHMTQAGHILGSAHYMSPEQARSGKVGTYTDVFGIGVMMYEMFTGERPFKGNDVRNLIIERIKYGEQPDKYSPPPMHEIKKEIPLYLNRIVFKCIAGNPTDRYQTATEVLQELKNFQNQYDLYHSIEVVLTEKQKKKILTNKKYSYGLPFLFSLIILLLGGMLIFAIFWGREYMPEIDQYIPFLNYLRNF